MKSSLHAVCTYLDYLMQRPDNQNTFKIKQTSEFSLLICSNSLEVLLSFFSRSEISCLLLLLSVFNNCGGEMDKII